MYRVEYSIVSAGTERAGSDGYMCITEAIAEEKYRLLCPEPHNAGMAKNSPSCIKCSTALSPASIAAIRFQLIAALAIPDWIKDSERIAVVGAGAIGAGVCLELKRRGIKAYSLHTRRPRLAEMYMEALNVEISTEPLEAADFIIDCTGESAILDNILAEMKPFACLQLLGTPRQNPTLNLLEVHRRNISILGGHELRGRSPAMRQEMWDRLEDWHIAEQLSIDSLARLHDYSEENRCLVLERAYDEPFHVMVHK